MSVNLSDNDPFWALPGLHHWPFIYTWLYNGKTLNKELLGYFSPLQMFQTPWRADLKINGEDLYGREVLSQTGSARDVLGAVGCRIYLHNHQRRKWSNQSPPITGFPRWALPPHSNDIMKWKYTWAMLISAFGSDWKSSHNRLSSTAPFRLVLGNWPSRGVVHRWTLWYIYDTYSNFSLCSNDAHHGPLDFIGRWNP